MIAKGFLPIVLTLCEMTYFSGGQHVPPGVPPQHYQQQPMGQQVPHMQQQQQQQHIPVQQQQMHMQQQQQQMHMQQQQPQMHMQQQPMQQVPVQQQMHQQPHQQAHHHGHGGQPQVLNVANIAQEKEHIQEHMSVPIDTSKMTEQELQFHYFKMHDADNNNKLDGCELIKSLIHWHAQGAHPAAGQKAVEEKLFKDDELVSLIDPILSLDDANVDGFIDYPEFVRAQQKAAAAGPPPGSRR